MKKGILLVANWPSDTGYAWWLMERFWVAIGEAYPDRRVLLAYPKVGALSPTIRNSRLEVIELKVDFSRPFRTAGAIRSLNVGTIYFTDRQYAHWFYALLRLTGVRHILIHDHVPGTRPRPPTIKRVSKYLLALFRPLIADRYIAVSPLVHERLLHVAILPASRCRLATNGIDIAAVEGAIPIDIRSELNIPKNSIIIVSSSRLSPYKRVDLIVDAAQIALRSNPSIHFVHCGDGPEMEALSRQCESQGISANFHFLGLRSDVLRILKTSDIAVHASTGEGLSLSVLEFMCATLPVIVADDPTVSQPINDGINGKLFRTGDKYSLANEIISLVENGETRGRLGEMAKFTIHRDYDLQRTISDVMRIFRDTVTD